VAIFFNTEDQDGERDPLAFLDGDPEEAIRAAELAEWNRNIRALAETIDGLLHRAAWAFHIRTVKQWGVVVRRLTPGRVRDGIFTAGCWLGRDHTDAEIMAALAIRAKQGLPPLHHRMLLAGAALAREDESVAKWAHQELARWPRWKCLVAKAKRR
jgi:hypothetical protein